jgi:hypothetical protein
MIVFYLFMFNFVGYMFRAKCPSSDQVYNIKTLKRKKCHCFTNFKYSQLAFVSFCQNYFFALQSVTVKVFETSRVKENTKQKVL